MFHKQKGLVPLVVTIAGLGLSGYFGCVSVYSLQAMLPTIIEAIKGHHSAGLVYVAAVLLLFGTGVAYGLGLSGMFPAISLTEKGLQLRHLLRFSVTIPWEKVEGVDEKARVPGWAAVVLARGPFGILLPGRYYFNYLYGLLAGGMQRRPVVLLTGSLAQNKALLDEIRHRARAPRKNT